MCRTYNMIGSLASLKDHLEDYNIHDFKSLKEVIDFKSSFTTYRQQVIAYHENLIEQEKESLKMELQQLDTSIHTEKKQAEQRWNGEMEKLKQQFDFSTIISPSSMFQKLVKPFRSWNYNRHLSNKKRIFNAEVLNPIDNLVIIRQKKERRYQFISSHFNLKPLNKVPKRICRRLIGKKQSLTGLIA